MFSRSALSGLFIGTFLVFVALSAGAVEGHPAPRPDQTLDQPLPKRVQNLLQWKTNALRNDGSGTIQRARLAGQRAPSSLNAIVMMCDFSDSLLFGRYDPDDPGDFPPPAQNGYYYAAHDSLYFAHTFQDVASYYQDISGGRFTFNFEVHPDVVNLPHPMSYYGHHSENGEQSVLLAADVVAQLDDDIDFASYDTYILVHAGAGEETDVLNNSPEQIYSTYLDADDFVDAAADSILNQPYIASPDFAEGEGISQVLILPECEFQDSTDGYGGRFGTLGVYCFEVGLRLGMLSLSDFTPAGAVDSQGIGEFGLMGYGLFVGLGYIPPHPCAFNKCLMGWLDPMEMDALGGGLVQLTPSERPGDPHAALRVNITGQEYWLLEYRQQDPDGSRIFSFPGDLNHNGVPDFYNAGNDTGGFLPAGEFFDPAEDIRESLQGAEWDFFMSENSARDQNDKGAGSGVYIWHIDEGVVWDTFGLSGNFFNADPDHKAVDLEEADGIQDLDSRTPSAYLLGGDDDSFRGEDNALFGPHSRPSTITASGAATGVVMKNFSPVVLDSAAFYSFVNFGAVPPDTVMGFTYADTISFEVATAQDQITTPLPVVRRDFPVGVDLRGSHVLMADLGADPEDEIVLAGHQGEIFVLDGELNEFLDHDQDPGTLEPFARGQFAGQSVSWNQPVAVGDLDADGSPDIVLSASEGLYAYASDGTALIDDPANTGLYVATGISHLPTVLIPRDRDASYAPTAAVDACIVHEMNGRTKLTLYRGVPAIADLDFDLGPVQALSPPVLGWDHLFITVRDTAGEASRLLALDVGEDQVPGQEIMRSLELEFTPGSFPVLLGNVGSQSEADPHRFAAIVGVDGMNQTVVFDNNFRAVSSPDSWPVSVQVASPLAPGGVFVAEGLLGRVGHSGSWGRGWPVRPLGTVAASVEACAGSPLVANLVGAPTPTRQFLLPTQDGRVFALGLEGEEVAGWPVAGPARSVGTPALGHARQLGVADLVTVGTFARITGLDDDGEILQTEDFSSISIFAGLAEAGSPWPMWGHSPWRNGNWGQEPWNGPAPLSAERGFVAGSHICYPNPLAEGPLHIRGRLHSAGRVRAYIHNLEGEEVTASDWAYALPQDPFTISLDLGEAVSGMYFCRLVAEMSGQEDDVSVVTFAVER